MEPRDADGLMMGVGELQQLFWSEEAKKGQMVDATRKMVESQFLDVPGSASL